MLYENAIEFFIKSWRQELSTECDSNTSTIHLSLSGFCDSIKVMCAIWLDEEAPEPSKIFRSAGLFKTNKSSSKLNELRSSATKAFIDIHVSSSFYDRLLDILTRNKDDLMALQFSASYEILLEKVTEESCKFGVHGFEVQEGILEKIE